MNDQEIIDLFWKRDQEAIRQTDAAYGSRLQGLAQRILNRLEDAQECVNDTYLKTWQAIPPTRPTYFYPFLAAICRHMALHKVDWNLAAKRKAEVVSLTAEMELCIPDRCQDRELESRQLRRVLNAFLESLPQEHRLVFLRRYWHADSIADIARRYGMTESKVKMQLHRTRNKLKVYLAQEGIRV